MTARTRLRRELRRGRRALDRARAEVDRAVASVRRAAVPSSGDPQEGRVVPEPTPVTAPVRRPEVLAAVLAGPRLRAGLGPEWQQLEVTPHDWRPRLASAVPTLLLLEAAELDGWTSERAGVLAATADLRALLDWCRHRGVPAVLWVTGAGASARRRAAALGGCVDRVATVDPATVDGWRRELGHDRVDVLGPAAQPRLHNPAVPAPAPPGERRPYAIELILDEPADAEPWASGPLADVVAPALRAGVDVWQSAEPGAPHVPLAFRRHTVGRLPYARLAVVPRLYRVALDAGDAHRAVPAWRVVEAGAAQTPVVTTPFGAELDGGLAAALLVAEDATTYRRQATAHAAHCDLRDRDGLRLHRAVLDAHTYGHRVDVLLGALGLASAPGCTEPSISTVVPTNRVHEIDNVLANVAGQSHLELELVLVLHGLDVDRDTVARRAEEAGIKHVCVLAAPAELTLGACLNLGVDAASGTYVAKMDDDNIYGRHYLRDLVRAFTWTDASVVGKWSHYVWLEASSAVVLRHENHEHTYTRLVQGGSMLMSREIVRSLRFADLPRAVDTDFLRRAEAEGARTYAADRFNYVSVRRSSVAGHTWKVRDVDMLTGSARLAFFGDPRVHVEV